MRKVFLALLAAALPAISALADVPAEEQMAHRIGSQLKQSGQLHNYEIGVKYHAGVAYLEGKVTSPEQRETAVHLAQKVKGVSRVECKLAITNQSKNDSDVEMASATEEGLADDSQAELSAMHAYQQREPATMPNQQMQMMRANGARMNGMRTARNNMPLPSRQMPSMMPVRQAGCSTCNGGPAGGPGMYAPGMCGPGMDGGAPMGYVPQGGGSGPNYDNASMPGYAWPSYASYPNYAALTYPKQYSPTAWPYIGPFYPYPQVPLAWRKVCLEWDDGWWFLDFSSHNSSH